MSRAEYMRAWRAANPDKVRGQKLRYKAKHPDRVREAQRLANIRTDEKRKAAIKARRLADPEAARAKARVYYAKNPGQWRDRNLRLAYGIGSAEVDAMRVAQSHRCKICRVEFSPVGAKNSDPRQMHVDHCHSTGKVRGLLCRDCNIGLGRFKDDPSSLTGAVAYLSNHSAPAFEPLPFCF